MNATKLMQTLGAIGSAIGGAAGDALKRPIQRRHPVLGVVLAAGIGMALLSGCGMVLAGTSAVITVLVTVVKAIASFVACFLRYFVRGVSDLVRANVALMVASLLAAPIFAISVLIPLLALWQRLQALARKAAIHPPARVGHRRIAHIALTARVVPAPIARA